MSLAWEGERGPNFPETSGSQLRQAFLGIHALRQLPEEGRGTMKPGTLCASAREGVESDKWNPLGTLQRSERGIRTMELKGEMCLTGSDFTEATSRRKTLLWVQVSRRADCQVCVWGARLFAFWPTGKQRSQACVRNRIDSPQGPPCNGTCCLGSRSQGFHNPPNMVNSWGPVVQTHEPVGVVWDLKLLQQGNRLGWY